MCCTLTVRPNIKISFILLFLHIPSHSSHDSSQHVHSVVPSHYLHEAYSYSLYFACFCKNYFSFFHSDIINKNYIFFWIFLLIWVGIRWIFFSSLLSSSLLYSFLFFFLLLFFSSLFLLFFSSLFLFFYPLLLLHSMNGRITFMY